MKRVSPSRPCLVVKLARSALSRGRGESQVPSLRRLPSAAAALPGFLLGIVGLTLLLQPALASVHFLEDKRIWVLETARTTYSMGINEHNQVQFLYWGARVRPRDLPSAKAPARYAWESREGLAPEEYPGFGGMRYTEPALKVQFADGVRDILLRYESHQIADESLKVLLRDIKRDLFVTLEYVVFPEEDVIRKKAMIDNRTSETVVVESGQSAVWYMPAGDGYRFTYLSGRWGAETQVTQVDVRPGRHVIESRRGNTSPHANPWWAIDSRNRADETDGDVWFGALGWSGNWKIAVGHTHQLETSIVGGFNDFDFAYPLQPGERLETPPFYGGFTSSGFGEASRIMHRLQRRRILPDRGAPKVRPVLYNSWYATEFDVTEAGQKALANRAAGLGVELFVVDDGWFGERNDDKAGLGDWYVNPVKFPNGLKPLIDQVHALGMDFGLWVEPEMVNPNSDLYRQHPDWVIHFPGRPRTEGRNQLVLNLGREDVKEHLFQVLEKLLSENDIAFLKWDMNRPISEPGWPALPLGEQKRIWVAYVQNLYEIFDRLRQNHPELEIESCSSGGGRLDLGIMERIEQVWASDNTEGLDRLEIQEGYSFAYAPKTMMNWVTDNPGMNRRSTPLEYRFHVAMSGSLGIGGNLTQWSEADMALAKKMVAAYKRVRESVQHGDLYRLLSPRDGDVSAIEYVSEDGTQAVLFAFREQQQFLRQAPPIRLRGLHPEALYRVEGIDEEKLAAPLGEPVSGAYLMHRGLQLRLQGDYDSTMVIVQRQ